MGLDITAYSKVRKIDCHFDAEGDPIDKVTGEHLDYDFQAYANPDFPGRNGSIEGRAIYAAADRFDFWAGGYGGYNAWRNELAQLAGYPQAPYVPHGSGTIQLRHDAAAWAAAEGAFWELINFSDCEGVIAPEVSKKLAQDFADYQDKADAHGDELFRGRFAEFRKAFELASDQGAVRFH